MICQLPDEATPETEHMYQVELTDAANLWTGRLHRPNRPYGPSTQLDLKLVSLEGQTCVECRVKGNECLVRQVSVARRNLKRSCHIKIMS